jgi:hypothetical protein
MITVQFWKFATQSQAPAEMYSGCTIVGKDSVLKVKLEYGNNFLFERWEITVYFSLAYYKVKTSIIKFDGRILTAVEKKQREAFKVIVQTSKKDQGHSQSEEVIKAIVLGVGVK